MSPDVLCSFPDKFSIFSANPVVYASMTSLTMFTYASSSMTFLYAKGTNMVTHLWDAFIPDDHSAVVRAKGVAEG